jgi:hypothetical protein
MFEIWRSQGDDLVLITTLARVDIIMQRYTDCKLLQAVGVESLQLEELKSESQLCCKKLRLNKENRPNKIIESDFQIWKLGFQFWYVAVT